MIIFKKLTYANFLSSGNYPTAIELNKADLTVIIGKNGAGKSTILDALSFVLFGKPFRRISKAQLVNSVTRKQCKVVVEFDIGTDTYRILRSIKPNKFEIHKNGTLIPEDAHTGDYQDYLERFILRCNYKSFCQVVVLGSASYIPFLDLPAANRREVVDNILDLEIIPVMSANLKKRVVETNEKMVDLQTRKSILVEKIKVYHEMEAKASKNNDNTIAEYQENIDAIKKVVEGNQKWLDEHPFDEDKYDSLLKEQSQSNDAISATGLANRDIENTLAKLAKEIGFYELHDNCPTCHQLITAEFKKRALQEKEYEYARLVKSKEHNRSIQTAHRDSVDILNLQIEELSVVKKKRDEVERFIRSKNNEIKVWLDGIKTINNRNDRASDDNFDELNKELIQINTEIDLTQNVKNAHGVMARLLKDDGAKAKMIGQYIDKINHLTNKFLYDMDFMCDFNLDGEFNETIKSRYRDEFTYASFSEGEKLRITLAILFTWREIAKERNSISTNILFFDEILDSSLDAEGTENFLNIIKALTKGSNTFIISHNSKSIDNIDNVLEFRKIKGFSHLT